MTTTEPTSLAPARSSTDRRRLYRPRRRRPLGVAVLLAAVTAGIVVRFVFATSPLWLDEAQTVAIAKMSFGSITTALRHDGSPPLYYWLLHGWLSVFGDSALAARSLSILLSVLTLPVLWLLTRRWAGDGAAAACAAITATSPFAIFFATEARPYSLVLFLTAVMALGLYRLLTRPSWSAAAAVSATTTALLLTHYWAGFLVAATFVALCLVVVAGWRRSSAVRAAGAVALGVALVLPWVPTLLFQLRHTGTPWAKPPTLAVVPEVYAQWSAAAQTIRFAGIPGVAYRLSLALACALFALTVLAVTAPIRPRPGTGLGHDTSDARAVARVSVVISVGALVLAVVVAHATRGGYEPRYTIAMFVAVPVVTAIGAFALPPRWRLVAVAAVCATGLTTTVVGLARPSKTQAGHIAAAIAAQARPGDVVVYCPDQLGPAVHRLLPAWLRQLPFPTAGSAATVDWVDYAARNRQASPVPFAAMVDNLARGRTVWLVDVPRGYATLDGKCGQLSSLLSRGRRQAVVVRADRRRYYEWANLLQLSPR